MLIVATAVFTYYTVWTLLMVRTPHSIPKPPFAHLPTCRQTTYASQAKRETTTSEHL